MKKITLDIQNWNFCPKYSNPHNSRKYIKCCINISAVIYKVYRENLEEMNCLLLHYKVHRHHQLFRKIEFSNINQLT